MDGVEFEAMLSELQQQTCIQQVAVAPDPGPCCHESGPISLPISIILSAAILAASIVWAAHRMPRCRCQTPRRPASVRVGGSE